MPLTIKHHTDKILHDISLHLNDGENLLILGPNGAGKTTLAKTLAGLRPSDTLTIDDVAPHCIYGQERTRRVNYVPTKLDVFDGYLRVEEFLKLSRFTDDLSVQDALNVCGIAHLQHRRCTTLSSGEGQLVLFASALLHRAAYTLFDEPTANLDPQHIRRVFRLLRDPSYFQSRILITHRLDMAYRLGWRVCYVDEGRILFDGSGEAFFSSDTLRRFFDDAVRIVNDYAVVAL